MTTELTRIEEIYAFVLPELASNQIEDTTANRLSALQGLMDGWKELQEDISIEQSIEKSLYMLALSTEIFVLQMKVGLQAYSTTTTQQGE